MSSFNDPTFLSVPPPPPPPRRRVRPWMLAAASILLVCCIAGIILAEIGNHDTPAPQASHPTATTATKEPTAMPSPTPDPQPKPSPTPATSQQAYNEWLTAEVKSLADVSVVVTDAIYADPPADDIIWIQTYGLTNGAAQHFCAQVASDYVAQFHQQVTVHFFMAPGTNNEQARCTDQP